MLYRAVDRLELKARSWPWLAKLIRSQAPEEASAAGAPPINSRYRAVVVGYGMG